MVPVRTRSHRFRPCDRFWVVGKPHLNGSGFDYVRLSKSNALFRSNPEFEKEVLAEAAKFADGQFLMKQLGKKVTELDMRAVLSGNAAGGSTGSSNGGSAQIDNTDDL
jgi:hypothetical protein